MSVPLSVGLCVSAKGMCVYVQQGLIKVEQTSCDPFTQSPRKLMMVKMAVGLESIPELLVAAWICTLGSGT